MQTLKRRDVRVSGESGAASLETTGMWALAAVLVAAVALVIVAAAPGLGDTVRRAICIVVTLGQGECGSATTSAAEHVPVNPCVLEAKGRESTIEGSFIVSLGTGEQWLVEELSDGRYKITRGTSGSVGVDTGVGLIAQVVVDDTPYGVTATANAGAKLTFKAGEVYYADDKDGVSDLLRQHVADVVKDGTVGPSGPIRWGVDQIDDLVGADTQLPEPSERYVEGGVELSADASTTAVVAGAAGKVGVSQVLGFRIGRDGTSTQYIQSTVNGSVGAGTWSGADDGSYQYSQIKAEGSVQAVVEIERDKDGEVTAVRTKMVMAGESAATNRIGGEVTGPSANGYVERTAELPIRSEGDRVLAMTYLRSLGIQEVGGLSVPIPVSALAGGGVASAVAFTDATRARGYVTEQSFDNDTRTDGFALGGEVIGKFGGAGAVNTVTRTSTGASYFDGTAWQPWRACG